MNELSLAGDDSLEIILSMVQNFLEKTLVHAIISLRKKGISLLKMRKSG